MSTFTTSLRVQFRDTDAAGIAHFSVFFTYMEEAEHEFLRHLGLTVHMQDGGETLSWPRVSARCDFESAVKFEEIVDIALRIGRLGEKSVTYTVEFSHAGLPVAHGSMTSVCCRLRSGQAPEPLVIPDWIREKLSAWMA
jgi:4-hydroxybenzoyl-CoA thioesterase/acyl-CoA thioester hydrolase